MIRSIKIKKIEYFLTPFIVHKKYLVKDEQINSDFSDDESKDDEDSSFEMDTEVFEDLDSEGQEENSPEKIFQGKIPGFGPPKLPLSLGAQKMKAHALNLDKARDLQEKMAIVMVDKVKNDPKHLSKEDLVEDYKQIKKENDRVIHILSKEIENQIILKKDYSLQKSLNKKLVRINTVLTSCYKKGERKRRQLEQENATYKRAYSAFNFFLKESELLKNPQSDLGKFMNELSSRYDPDEDYTFRDIEEGQPPSNGESQNEGRRYSQDREPEVVDQKERLQLKQFATGLKDKVQGLEIVKIMQEGDIVPVSSRMINRVNHRKSYSIDKEVVENFDRKMDVQGDYLNQSLDNDC